MSLGMEQFYRRAKARKGIALFLIFLFKFYGGSLSGYTALLRALFSSDCFDRQSLVKPV